MGAYLIDNPPAVRQWYERRSRPLTGCTVLHSSESVMDTVGPDTGAEAVARFIQGRTTAGSYHDLVDSDSWIRLVPLINGAFHDGTGSNNWALSISFALRTVDWRTMTAAKRAGFLRQGARAFADQQAWRRANRLPLTELRLITKAQSDAGQSGFIYHGHRDPGRRSDPGVAAPNLFPFDEFIDHCRAALAGDLEDDMPTAREVADALLDTPIERRGPGATGITTPRAIFQWFDYHVSNIPNEVLNRKIPRQGGVNGDTTASQTFAWLDSTLSAIRAAVTAGQQPPDPQ